MTIRNINFNRLTTHFCQQDKSFSYGYPPLLGSFLSMTLCVHYLKPAIYTTAYYDGFDR